MNEQEIKNIECIINQITRNEPVVQGQFTILIKALRKANKRIEELEKQLEN